MLPLADLAADPRFAPVAGLERSVDDVRVHSLAPGAWILRLPLPYPPTPSLNAYLFRARDGFVLVDCGTTIGPGWDALERALTLVGVAPADVGLLITTHPHTDHASLAATVIEHTGCDHARFDGPLAQLERLRDHWIPIEERRALTRSAGVPEEVLETWIEAHIAGDGYAAVPRVDRLLRPGDAIETDIGRLVVHAAAGHSSSMLMLWQPERRLLVSADLVLATEFQFFEWGHLDDPFTVHLTSLERALALDPALLLPGHGRPLHHGIDARIRGAVAASIAERDLIQGLVGDVPQTPFGLAMGVVPAEADLDMRQAHLSVVLSVIDHLAARGEIELRVEDGICRVRRPALRGS